MKFSLVTLIIALVTIPVYAQKAVGFNKIDSFAVHTDDTSLSLLTQKLTQPYKTDSEKLRSIFRWITAHIDYDVEELHHRTDDYEPLKQIFYASPKEMADSLYDLAVARMVLRKRKGICDGYSRLLAVMCRNSRIECVKVNGFGRTADSQILGRNFDSNHSWNAVKLDSAWHLLDATWASGYCNGRSTTFTRAFNQNYYLAPPQRFALNHYPDDPKWLLLQPALDKNLFLQAPNPTADLYNLKIRSYSPASGVIRYGRSREVHLALIAMSEIRHASIFENRDEHRIYLKIELTQENAQTVSPTLQNKATISKTHSARSVKVQTQTINDPIQSILDYVNSVPAGMLADTLSNAGPCRLNGTSVAVKYSLPEGLYKEIYVFCNDLFILKYELIF